MKEGRLSLIRGGEEGWGMQGKGRDRGARDREAAHLPSQGGGGGGGGDKEGGPWKVGF